MTLRRPPSTTCTAPLRYAPPFPTKYRIVPAASSKLPWRPAGTQFGGKLVGAPTVISEGKTERLVINEIYRWPLDVDSLPGQMMLLRMPHGASKLARTLPSATAPALLEAYGRPAVMRRLNAAMLATVIIWLVLKSVDSPFAGTFRSLVFPPGEPSATFPDAQPLCWLALSRRCKNAAATPTTALVFTACVVAQPSQLVRRFACSSSIDWALYTSR
jgi:hypothetical protein